MGKMIISIKQSCIGDYWFVDINTMQGKFLNCVKICKTLAEARAVKKQLLGG